MRGAAIRIQRKITESEQRMHDPAGRAAPAADSMAGGPVAPWWHTAVVVALLVVTSVLSGWQAQRGTLGSHHAGRYLSGIAVEWVLLLIVWWGLRAKRVALAEVVRFRRGLAAIGEDLAAAGVFWMIAVVILATIGLLLRLAHLAAPQKTLMAIAPSTPLELLLWVVLSLSAGFCEEVVFRGYLLRQFASMGAGAWMGIVGSSLLFGVSHGYEGAAGMTAITAYGALFCALVFVRRSLRPGMIAHAWHDIFSGAMLALLRHFHPM
jgi:uncharacterized protein